MNSQMRNRLYNFFFLNAIFFVIFYKSGLHHKEHQNSKIPRPPQRAVMPEDVKMARLL